MARWSPVCFEVTAEGRTVRDAASYTLAAVQQTVISSTAGEGRCMQLKVRRIQPSRLDIQGLAEVRWWGWTGLTVLDLRPQELSDDSQGGCDVWGCSFLFFLVFLFLYF